MANGREKYYFTNCYAMHHSSLASQKIDVGAGKEALVIENIIESIDLLENVVSMVMNVPMKKSLRNI